MKPTREQVQEAREILEEAEFLDADEIAIDAIRTLVDATALPETEGNEARNLYEAYENAFWGTNGEWEHVTDADKKRWGKMSQYLKAGEGAK